MRGTLGARGYGSRRHAQVLKRTPAGVASREGLLRPAPRHEYEETDNLRAARAAGRVSA